MTFFINPKKLILIIVVLLLSQCKDDPNTTKLQYMPDMADTPTVKPQRDFLDPPEGSVAQNAILYPETSAEAEKLLVNPYVGRSDEAFHTEQGKHLYEVYCSVCHGPTAKGNGTIVDEFPKPPDLTTDLYLNRGDGFYFHVITFGSALMPKYGHALSPHERWQVILYLKTLQKAKP